MIRKGAEHLNRLLAEILDLTKVEVGAMPIVPEPQDVRRLVADDLPPTLLLDRPGPRAVARWPN